MIYGHVNRTKIIPQIRALKTLPEIHLIVNSSYFLAMKILLHAEGHNSVHDVYVNKEYACYKHG